MKINLPKHHFEVKTRSQLQGDSTLGYLGLKEIPIGYISLDDVIKNPKVSIEKDFLRNSKKQVMPYDVFTKSDVYLFDISNNIVKRTMKRIGDSYYYEPKNQVEYTPLNFDVYLRMQRQQQYYNDRIYDIKVSAVETGINLDFLQNLMVIFGNSYSIGLCPANIRFNGGSNNYMSLLENDYYSSDFVFIKSHDGIHYGDSMEEIDEVPLNTMLDNHTNVWLFCDEYGNHLEYFSTYDTVDTILRVNNPILYNTVNYSVPMSHALLFNQNVDFIESEGSSVHEYEYMCEAVLIMHVTGKGFVIISPSWFLDHLEKVAPIMYEAMMKCYLSGYYKSRTLSAWITDEPVDYISYNVNHFGQRHNRLTIYDFLADEKIDEGSYKIADIRVTTPYVKYDGMTSKNELLFKKVGGVTDPVKNSDEMSFYTTNHTVINYQPESLFTVETAIDLEFTTTDNTLFLIVHPYVSSSNNIHTISDQTFKIEDVTVDYSLYVNEGSSDIHNTFYLLKATEAFDSSYLKVADITFETEKMPAICDTRIAGGGLPEDQPDDYDMLDIGHVLGRPYRVGSSLIVRLPIKYQSYENRIISELEKHVAAGDEFVVVFERKT